MSLSLRQVEQTPTVLEKSEICFLHLICLLHTTAFRVFFVE
ncbi:hypothetical protein MtrunA17_Chr7g0249751 [Medicago truncatula]|uniref:Uncharacterized protein n=1 Tax=Medicago truncatula TaxID=3880 RepID=A0A396H7J2_MEDTR|nr:hypothetical protein MtrunA17_Chr7g0249751 [Medicago truncatula]